LLLLVLSLLLALLLVLSLLLALLLVLSLLLALEPPKMSLRHNESTPSFSKAKDGGLTVVRRRSTRERHC